MRKSKIPYILLGIFMLGLIGVTGAKDMLIINFGFRLFEAFRIFVIGGTTLSAIASGNALLYRITQKQKQNRIEAYNAVQEEEIRALETKKQARLSVQNDIDPAYLKEELKKAKWPGSVPKDSIHCCIEQLDRMDTYQDRFHKLLIMNGATAFHDTEDVINEVEQFMCKNVRNVINYMTIADENDWAAVAEKLQLCNEENENLLGQTKDFMVAMADYLNDQGGSADTELLESYKATLMKTVQKESVL